MADSDGEYIQGISDDENDMQIDGRSSYGTRAKGKGRTNGRDKPQKARWEGSINLGTSDDTTDGAAPIDVESLVEARKRKR